jgi:ribosomal protein S18 acetylase RimI-like enzyme
MTETGNRRGPARVRHASREDGRALSIRAATLDDLDVIVELRVALLRAHASNAVYGRIRPDVEERARRLFARQLESRDEVLFLAERDGRVIGCLRCMRALGSPLLFPAEYAYVSSVFVRPEARRAGVLRALMTEAELWCAARGLTEMRLHNASDNEVACATWQALGFDLVEQVRLRRLAR